MWRELTVIIPYSGRPEFLKRQLKFYEAIKFNPKIILLPACENDVLRLKEDNFLETLEIDVDLVEPLPPKQQQVADSLQLNSRAPLRLRIEVGINLAQTPFVIMGSDDDFLCAEGVAAAIKLLRSNDSAVSARGLTAFLTVRNSASLPTAKSHGSFVDLWVRSSEYEVTGSTPTLRANDFMRSCDTKDLWNQWHAVVRRDCLSQIIEDLGDQLDSDFVLWELGLQLGLLKYGTCVVTPSVSYVRQLGTSQLTRGLNEQNSLKVRIGDSEGEQQFILMLSQLGMTETSSEILDTFRSWLSAHSQTLSREGRIKSRLKVVRDVFLFHLRGTPPRFLKFAWFITHKQKNDEFTRLKPWKNADISKAILD